MYKSNHDYNGFIPYGELRNFIEPINVNIDVPIMDIDNFLSKSPLASAFILKKYKLLLEFIPTLNKLLGEKYIPSIACITYNSHTCGYDFRMNPIDIFNNIFKYLELDYRLPFINLDTVDGMNYFKDYVRSYIKDIARINQNEVTLAIMEEINTNLDNICKFYYISLDNCIKDSIIPKDALFYLSFRSLYLFEMRHDPKYLVMPYEYYHYVSHMNNSPYPHKVRVNESVQKYWFDDFRLLYERSVGSESRIDASKYLLNDHEVLIAWDILTPGMVERELRDVGERHRSSPNVDYEKYQKLFELKMNYYMNSPYVKYILGKYGLKGYIGFSYQNEYLVFDKFHNSDTIDPSRKTILTHGEAIYALPSDRFTIVTGSKQDIIGAKKTDERIKRIIHTDNGSFVQKIDDIIHGPNVSTTTFEKVIEQEKGKMLIKR